MIDTNELRAYMARRDGMTLAELAKKIGKSPATVSRWLEKRDMPVQCAERIIDTLNIPIEEAMSIFLPIK